MSEFFDFDRISDVSGGSAGAGGGTASGDTTTETVPSFEQLITDEGGSLAVAYGEHIVAGHLIAHKYETGPPPSSKIIVAGGEGEWEGVVTCWYSAEEIALSPDGSTAGYHFYPGTIPVSTTDPTQPVDSFLSTGLAYNSTSYLAVLLPEKFATEDRPDKLKWRPKCKKVYTYDVNGVPSTSATYSVNPADIAVDRIRKYYETRYEDDNAKALRLFRNRVDWSSYTDWRNYNESTISWDDGTTTRDISRFECHIAFTVDLGLADALNAICATCATLWQDDGQQIKFIPPNNTTIEHHFDESNIVSGSFSITPRDMRDRPNYIVAEFRDLDDTYLAPTKTPPAYRQDLIDRVGRVRPSNRPFANMYRSQAERLLQRQLRLEADNPNIVSLRGMGDSFHVLPGDYVTVSHSVAGWTYKKCLVLDVSADGAEKSADEVDFALQAIDSAYLYSDTDHTKKQAEVTP